VNFTHLICSVYDLKIKKDTFPSRHSTCMSLISAFLLLIIYDRFTLQFNYLLTHILSRKEESLVSFMFTQYNHC